MTPISTKQQLNNEEPFVEAEKEPLCTLSRFIEVIFGTFTPCTTGNACLYFSARRSAGLLEDPYLWLASSLSSNSVSPSR